MEAKKILVTGTGGYLADRICQELVNQGHQVRAMFRSGNGPHCGDSLQIEAVRADLMNMESLRPAIEGCDEIYHVAAFAKSWAKDPSMFYKVNIGGTQNLLELAKKLGVKRVVVTSSAGAIGPAGPCGLAKEDQCREVNFFGDYESSKFIMNERIQDFVREGLDVRIVCPTRIFGPGNLNSTGNLITKIMNGYLKGRWRFRLGDGKDEACYAFIDDVVQGHILAMERGKAGEKYLIGSFNDTYNGVIATLAEISGIKRVMIPIPFFIIKGYAVFVGGLAKLFSFDPVITTEWVKKLKQNWQADLSKAKNELGFVPTSKEEAIRKTVDWLKTNS